jgi:hypothetical protein
VGQALQKDGPGHPPSTVRDQPSVSSEEEQSSVLVFCAYSHNDERFLDQLKEHLAALRREGLIVDWYDRKIGPGQDWEAEIVTKLESADVFLLLVSSSFIHSDYCFGKEMKTALSRHAEGNVIVIPVIVRPVDWHHTPMGRLQAVPKDGKAVTSWKNRDEAWAEVARSVRTAVKSLRPSSLGSEPAPTNTIEAKLVPGLNQSRAVNAIARSKAVSSARESQSEVQLGDPDREFHSSTTKSVRQTQQETLVTEYFPLEGKFSERGSDKLFRTFQYLQEQGVVGEYVQLSPENAIELLTGRGWKVSVEPQIEGLGTGQTHWFATVTKEFRSGTMHRLVERGWSGAAAVTYALASAFEFDGENGVGIEHREE